jgi:cell division protein FtsW
MMGDTLPSRQQQATFSLDMLTVSIVAVILLVGLVMVTSASVAVGTKEGEPFGYLWKQLLSLGVGTIAAVVIMRQPVEIWQRYSTPLLVVAFVLLLAVLIPGIGHAVKGSRRWIHLGPLNFQASELARVLMLTYIASYVVRREAELKTSFQGLFFPLMMLTVGAGLLLIEPDFGSGVILLSTGLGVLFLSGARIRDVLLVCGAGAVLIGLVAVSAAYRLKRLTAFLDPWADPNNTGYQLTQSLIAIGRGEWWGVGLGASVQKLFYLPEAHTDFVFAVLSEEFGFIGITVMVTLVLALALRALVIARNAAKCDLKFHAAMAAAFGIWYGLQSFTNMGVNMGLLPTKGLTLPLLSYGRSSLITTVLWLGVLLRIHHETVQAQITSLRGKLR